MERQSISQLVHQEIPKSMEGFLLYNSSKQRPSALQLFNGEALSLSYTAHLYRGSLLQSSFIERNTPSFGERHGS